MEDYTNSLTQPILEVVDEDGSRYCIVSEIEFELKELQKKDLFFCGYYGYIKDDIFYQSRHKKYKHPKIKYAKTPAPTASIKVQEEHKVVTDNSDVPILSLNDIRGCMTPTTFFLLKQDFEQKIKEKLKA
ncbi:MAG: hypothetical protein V4547_09590 [Bacteroidota bacterium]